MDREPWDIRIDAEEMRRIGYRVVDVLVERFSSIAEVPAIRVGDRAQLDAALREPMPERGTGFDAIVDRLQLDVLPYMATLAHPRFFAFISSPGNFIGTMADALTSGFNPFVGTWLGGSGPTQLELVTVDWLRSMCGIPEGGGGLFTSGGSMANLTGLGAMRAAKAPGGVDGATVYLTSQTHYSNARALRVLGFRENAQRMIACDPAYRMDVDALRATVAADLRAGLKPVCVVATAGTTSVGAVDPIDAIADACAELGMWLHVDGAFGAAAAISPRLRPALSGIERSDSLSLDPHKWMFQPVEIGCLLVRDMRQLRETYQVMPDYLKEVHALGEVNFADHGVQLTRNFRALKLWMSLQYFGAARLRRAVERGVEIAEYADAALRARPHWEILTPAQMAIVSFRYVPENTPGERLNAINDEIVREMMRDGFAMLSSTVLDGRTALRLCTINPATTPEDIDQTIGRMEKAVARILSP